MRRLPVYLLLDCSESMIGEGISALQSGMDALLRSLRTDPHALETVWLSCITFDREARLVFPLTELTEVQAPKLRVRPGTALGAALELCSERIQKEVQKTTASQKGDWRPLIVVITDGQPTDDWSSALRKLGTGVKPRPANIYAIGCGDDVDTASLQKLTEIVLHMPDMSEDKFKKLFVWLTASVTEGSHGVHETNDGIKLDKLPQDALRKVDHSYLHQQPGLQRQVMLFAKCCQRRQPYLMRYRWNESRNQYNPVAVYPLELEEGGGSGGRSEGFEMPAINSSQIYGIPPCPHCESPGAARCAQCGGLMCASPGNFVPVNCPHCGMYLDAQGSGGSSFDVKQSLA
jgi:uncharacterized protein YegL